MRLLEHAKNIIAASIAATSFLFPVALTAADTDGNFSIRGFGSVSCQDFISIVNENDTETLLTHAHWLQGYFSAQNRIKSDTFDTIPVYRTEDMLILVRSICERIPEQPVETAANAAVTLFERAHETAASELKAVEHDGQQTLVRTGVIAKVQGSLLNKGYYDSAVDGLFGRRTATAISNYQKEASLPETGLPDLATLVELFVD